MRRFIRRFMRPGMGSREGRSAPMEREGNEVHLDTNEARAGSEDHVVRWVLRFGTAGVVIAFIVVAWIMLYR
jgi:hypothetical protein